MSDLSSAPRATRGPFARGIARRAPLLLVPLLAAATLLMAQAPPPPQPAGAPLPRLVAVDPVWDAGTVASGAKLTHEFTLRNEGADALFVRDVRPSCGCTVVSFDSTVPAGGSARVRAEVDTGAFRGAIAKEITVYTSDAANPAITLTVKAIVRPPVDALPGYFRFRHLQGQAEESAAQTVWSNDPGDFKITGVESTLPQLHVAARPASAAERHPEGSGAQWVVVATLASDAPVGPLAGDVVVTTNDAAQPKLSIPVAGDVRPLMALVPPVVDFGSFTAGEPRRGSFLVVNNGKDPLQVLTVDTDVRGLTAKLQPRDAGKRWDVLLTVDADAPKGPLQGTVRVHTSAPAQALLEARIVGTVR